MLNSVKYLHMDSATSIYTILEQASDKESVLRLSKFRIGNIQVMWCGYQE